MKYYFIYLRNLLYNWNYFKESVYHYLDKLFYNNNNHKIIKYISYNFKKFKSIININKLIFIIVLITNLL